MTPFSYSRATSVADALIAGREGARFIAGGTTLVDLMREEVERPERLIDINALPLNYVRADGRDLVIGALARMSEVAEHPLVLERQPLVSQALLEGASPQLRNMASIGGNLLQRVRCPYFRMLDAACNKRAPGSGCSAIDGVNHNLAILGTSQACAATHPSDLAVALVALGATMRVLGPGGERSFPVADLFRLPGSTPHLEHTLRPGELITEVRVPAGDYAKRTRYLKVRDRASYEFAVVSAGVALDVRNGVVQAARIACGGVGTRPWRMSDSERALVGQPAARAAFERAATLSTRGARPLDHNKHKVELLPRTITRALEMAMEAA